MKKVKHTYRWRTSWKQRKHITRPTEEAAFRNIGGFVFDYLPTPPKIMVGDRLGEVLLLFLARRLTGLADLRSTDDLLTDTHDFDYKQKYLRIAEHLDKKGRLTYWNPKQKQHQKTRQPLLIADILSELLPFQVTPQEVLRAQRYVEALAKADEND